MGERHPHASIASTHPDAVELLAPKELPFVLEELVENAVIHSDREEPAVDITVTDRPGSVEVAIADDGPGIPEMERRIVTGDDGIEPLYHGSGLGLWLVALVVRDAGGDLAFAENEPRGSVVIVELPRSAQGE